MNETLGAKVIPAAALGKEHVGRFVEVLDRTGALLISGVFVEARLFTTYKGVMPTHTYTIRVQKDRNVFQRRSQPFKEASQVLPTNRVHVYPEHVKPTPRKPSPPRTLKKRKRRAIEPPTPKDPNVVWTTTTPRNE